MSRRDTEHVVVPRLSAMEQMSIKSYLYHGHPFVLYVYQDTKDVPLGTTVLDGNAILHESQIFTYEGDGFGRKSYAVLPTCSATGSCWRRAAGGWTRIPFA